MPPRWQLVPVSPEDFRSFSLWFGVSFESLENPGFSFVSGAVVHI